MKILRLIAFLPSIAFSFVSKDIFPAKNVSHSFIYSPSHTRKMDQYLYPSTLSSVVRRSSDSSLSFFPYSPSASSSSTSLSQFRQSSLQNFPLPCKNTRKEINQYLTSSLLANRVCSNFSLSNSANNLNSDNILSFYDNARTTTKHHHPSFFPSSNLSKSRSFYPAILPSLKSRFNSKEITSLSQKNLLTPPESHLTSEGSPATANSPLQRRKPRFGKKASTFAYQNNSLFPAFSSSSANGSEESAPELSTPRLSPPTNVVKEVPTLDVGPLTVVTVSEGNTARLPCQHQSFSPDDTVRLVLWYRNDTSRPLLSYDARDRTGDLSFIEYEAKKMEEKPRNKRRRSAQKGGRIYLSKSGSVLIVRETHKSDQAEYRCTVHYKRLPAVTYRLQLVVKETISTVQLFNSSGKKVGDQVGPLSEGSKLKLTCKAHYIGKLIDLKWLVEGEVVTASRVHVEADRAEIDISLTVERRHAHSALTCRLVYRHIQTEGGVKASITDASTTILLFYVPQATLLLDDSVSDGIKIQPEGSQGGGNVQIMENQRIKFVCVVRARPPPYNITWLLNGHVLSSGVRRRVIGNSFLEISPVERFDSGVYACLASNTEGDGHSNAIMVSVNHAPYCIGPVNRQIILVRNSSATLTCTVESNPPNVTFTWRVNHENIRKDAALHKDRKDEEGGIINGDHRFNYVPKFIDLVPTSNKTISQYVPSSRSTYMAYGPSLPHSVDPTEPTRSHLTITPGEESLNIVCFAKNNIGRMRVPCSFNIITVDPLMPPQLCSVLKTESASLEVACSEYPQGTEPVKQYVPGPSYVRSPEARTVSMMEVWSKDTLLANVTDSHSRWIVKGLPPDTELRLKLYSSSPHTQSEPVILYTRTNSRPLATTQAVMDVGSTEENSLRGTSSSLEEVEDMGSIDEITWIMGIVAGVVGLLLVIAALVGVVVLRTTRKFSDTQEANDSELQQTVAIDDVHNESVWESPALLLKKERTTNQTEFIEEVESPTGEDCKLIESEEIQEISLPSCSGAERGIT